MSDPIRNGATGPQEDLTALWDNLIRENLVSAEVRAPMAVPRAVPTSLRSRMARRPAMRGQARPLGQLALACLSLLALVGGLISIWRIPDGTPKGQACTNCHANTTWSSVAPTAIGASWTPGEYAIADAQQADGRQVVDALAARIVVGYWSARLLRAEHNAKAVRFAAAQGLTNDPAVSLVVAVLVDGRQVTSTTVPYGTVGELTVPIAGGHEVDVSVTPRGPSEARAQLVITRLELAR